MLSVHASFGDVEIAQMVLRGETPSARGAPRLEVQRMACMHAEHRKQSMACRGAGLSQHHHEVMMLRSEAPEHMAK